MILYQYMYISPGRKYQGIHDHYRSLWCLTCGVQREDLVAKYNGIFRCPPAGSQRAPVMLPVCAWHAPGYELPGSRLPCSRLHAPGSMPQALAPGHKLQTPRLQLPCSRLQTTGTHSPGRQRAIRIASQGGPIWFRDDLLTAQGLGESAELGAGHMKSVAWA